MGFLHSADRPPSPPDPHLPSPRIPANSSIQYRPGSLVLPLVPLGALSELAKGHPPERPYVWFSAWQEHKRKREMSPRPVAHIPRSEARSESSIHPARLVRPGSLLDLGFYVPGPGVLRTNMGCKPFLELLREVLLHFIERIADGRSRGIEHPGAFRATPASRSLVAGPCQFAAHSLPGASRDLVPICSCETGGIQKRGRVLIPKGCCLWDIQRWQEFLSQPEVILGLSNHLVAFTRRFFEFPAVHDLHCPSHVFDDPFFLQDCGRQAHRRSVRAHHRRDKIVRDRQRSGIHPVLGHQQPPRESLLDVVQPVARRRLCHLHSLQPCMPVQD